MQYPCDCFVRTSIIIADGSLMSEPNNMTYLLLLPFLLLFNSSVYVFWPQQLEFASCSALAGVHVHLCTVPLIDQAD